MIVNLIVDLESDSYRNRRSNPDGLESKWSTIWFRVPKCLSLFHCNSLFNFFVSGAKLKFIHDNGHVASYLFKQDVFRNAIYEALDALVLKYGTKWACIIKQTCLLRKLVNVRRRNLVLSKNIGEFHSQIVIVNAELKFNFLYILVLNTQPQMVACFRHCLNTRIFCPIIRYAGLTRRKRQIPYSYLWLTLR